MQNTKNTTHNRRKLPKINNNGNVSNNIGNDNNNDTNNDTNHNTNHNTNNNNASKDRKSLDPFGDDIRNIMKQQIRQIIRKQQQINTNNNNNINQQALDSKNIKNSPTSKPTINTLLKHQITDILDQQLLKTNNNSISNSPNKKNPVTSYNNKQQTKPSHPPSNNPNPNPQQPSILANLLSFFTGSPTKSTPADNPPINPPPPPLPPTKHHPNNPNFNLNKIKQQLRQNQNHAQDVDWRNNGRGRERGRTVGNRVDRIGSGGKGKGNGKDGLEYQKVNYGLNFDKLTNMDAQDRQAIFKPRHKVGNTPRNSPHTHTEPNTQHTTPIPPKYQYPPIIENPLQPTPQPPTPKKPPQPSPNPTQPRTPTPTHNSPNSNPKQPTPPTPIPSMISSAISAKPCPINVDLLITHLMFITIWGRSRNGRGGLGVGISRCC